MHSPSDNVVELAVLRERTVSAFVTDNPHAGAHAALDKSVENPCAGAHERRRQEINLEGEPDKHGCVDDIADEVGEGFDCRALKAVSGHLVSQEAIGDFLGLVIVSMEVASRDPQWPHTSTAPFN